MEAYNIELLKKSYLVVLHFLKKVYFVFMQLDIEFPRNR